MKKLNILLLLIAVIFVSCDKEKNIEYFGIFNNFYNGYPLKVGVKEQLYVIVVPESERDIEVIWSSSNTDVATISGDCLLETIGYGSATIECRTLSNKHFDRLTISVAEDYVSDICGNYYGTLLIDDMTINDVMLALNHYSYTPEKMTVNLRYLDFFISSTATFSYHDGTYYFTIESFFDQSNMTMTGTLEDEYSINLTFKLDGGSSQEIVFTGFKEPPIVCF